MTLRMTLRTTGSGRPDNIRGDACVTADEALDKIAAARAGTRKAVREAPEVPSQVDMIYEMAQRRAAGNSPATGGSSG